MSRIVGQPNLGRSTRLPRGTASFGLACRRAGVATLLGSCSILLAAGASGDDGDGPVLAPPADMPAATRPAPIARPSTPSSRPGARAVLALPGMTPAAPRESSAPTLSSTPSTAGGPLLEAPLEMSAIPGSSASTASTSPSRSPRPLVLESTPGDSPSTLNGPSGRPGPSTKRPSVSARVDPPANPASSRRGGLFGLFRGPQPPANPARPYPDARPNTPGRALAEDATDELAAEAALKKRIEKQARIAVGDRARSVEVELSGRAATVSARGVKLFQKRAVRKSLESIPALSGLRSTVEVLD